MPDGMLPFSYDDLHTQKGLWRNDCTFRHRPFFLIYGTDPWHEWPCYR